MLDKFKKRLEELTQAREQSIANLNSLIGREAEMKEVIAQLEAAQEPKVIEEQEEALQPNT